MSSKIGVKGVSLVAVLSLLCISGAVIAAVVGIEGISISPSEPTTQDPIQINSSLWQGYLEIDYTGSDFQVSGTSVEINFYFYDPDPAATRFPVAYSWSQPTDIGLLSAGTYNVTSNVWLAWYDYPPILVDSASTFFTVIPEPGTLVFVGLSCLVILMKRKR